jgi:hypothetical protein
MNRRYFLAAAFAITSACMDSTHCATAQTAAGPAFIRDKDGTPLRRFVCAAPG